jgi:hypothetical protein
VLAAALVVVGWLVMGPGNAKPEPSRGLDVGGSTPAVSEFAAQISTMSGRLRDGTRYVPLLHLDADESIGSALSADGTVERLLRRRTGDAVQELRRLPKTSYPQFLGLTVSDGFLYWVEEVLATHGSGMSIWRTSLDGTVAPVQVTDDTGDGVFYNLQYDLVFAAGRVHWIAVASADRPVTEVRSMPVAGGRVEIATFEGGHKLTAWPWMMSSGRGEPQAELVNIATGQRIRVPKSTAEIVDCTPVWCRATALPGSGSNRFDLMKPDGSQRRQIGTGRMRPTTYEIAILDRFEVVSDGDGRSGRLMLYDIDARTLRTVADGVATVFTRGGMLCWSTGEQDTADWHALDLRTVSR